MWAKFNFYEGPNIDLILMSPVSLEYRGSSMAKCPKCGADVAQPRKTWEMAGRPDKQGKRLKLKFGLFDCPNCKKAFKITLAKEKV